MEAIYTATERWEPLATLLLERVDHLETPEEKLLTYQRLATIYEQRLAQAANAFFVLQRASQEVPEDTQVLAELERLAGAEDAEDMWRDLYDTYVDTLEHVGGIVATDITLKAAHIQEAHLDTPLAAIALYERALEDAPENEAALRALVRLNEAERRYTQLVDAQWGLAEVTPDYTEKLALLRRRGEVYAAELDDAPAAIAAWRAVLDVDEMDRAALDALEQLYIGQTEWDALIDVYERLAQLDPERETELKLKIAGILEARLERVDDAIDIYEEVLTFDTSNLIARERLETLYADRNDWGRLRDVYERAFNAAQDDDERVQIARNIALLQDEVFEDPIAAADAYQQILTLKPGDKEAFDALERIYRAQTQWDDLIGLYESQFEMAPSSDDRAAALASMARVYRDELHDVDNAIGMFERALLERRDDREVLDALDALYRDTEMWEQVLEVTERKLEVETGPDARVVLLMTQGEVAERQLMDNYRASEAYQRALKEQPGHPDAVEALVAVYRRDERWEKVVEALEHKLAHAGGEIAASAVHVELAEVYRDALGRSEEALSHLESAVSKDAESRSALAALADHYMLIEEWVKAKPLLDLLVDKLDPEADREELFIVRKRLGRCAEAMADEAGALDEYGLAAGLLPPDRETLTALARLNFKRANYAEAERYFQDVVDTYKDDMSSEEHMQLYMQLGESALKLGHFDSAQRYLREVVDHQPQNTAALGQIVEVLVAYEDWSNALAYMERLLSLLDDDIERYQLQLQIGDIYAQRLEDYDKAIVAYREALHLDVFPKEPALRLFELSLSKKDYVDAISPLNRLIKLEEDPTRKAKFAYSAAVLYRDELEDQSQAIKYFNVALDHDASNLQAFRTIDELLTKARQWKPLEQNYRRMIERVSAQGSEDADKLLFVLYKGLGEIYRSRLKRLDYAIHAFELARKQRPDDESVREILASLYEVTPEGVPRAIEHHRFLVEQRPNRYQSYHQLVQLLKKSGQADAAWTVAGLLIALGQANAEETRFYETYVSPGMAEPQRVVDQTTWLQGVMSRGEDPEIGQIFELVYEGLGKYLADQPLKAFGLKKRNRLDLDEGLLVCTTIKQVARTFGMQPPEVYLSGEATGIEILPTAPPTLRLGTDMMQGRTDKELAFHVTKRLMYFHPWHVIATLYSRDQLDHLYMAAASLADPGFKLPLPESLPDDERAQIAQVTGEVRAQLERSASSEIKQQLTTVMQSFWSRKATPAIGAWHRHVELTANHAATIACGDVALAGQLVRDEAVGMSKLTRHEKLKDFVQYVIAADFSKTRRQLGVQIEYSELLG